jgi:hypothetical protein
VKLCIFVIRWFFHAEIVFFEESVLWNTVLSVNVNQCEYVFGISWFSNFYRLSSWLNSTLSHHTGALGLRVQ